MIKQRFAGSGKKPYQKILECQDLVKRQLDHYYHDNTEPPRAVKHGVRMGEESPLAANTGP